MGGLRGDYLYIITAQRPLWSQLEIVHYTRQYSVMHYSRLQCIIVEYSRVEYGMVEYSSIQSSTVLYTTEES